MEEDDQESRDHELLTDRLKRLEEEAHRIGLHVEEAGGMRQHAPDGRTRLVMMAAFVVGDLAFTDEVADPEKDEWDRRFEDIQRGEIAESAKKMFERWGEGDYGLNQD